MCATTTITLAEVLTGPLPAGNEALARSYRGLLQSWQLIDLDTDIAETATRLRATLRRKLPDAVQTASALAVGAAALVTHDRNFSRMTGLQDFFLQRIASGSRHGKYRDLIHIIYIL